MMMRIAETPGVWGADGLFLALFVVVAAAVLIYAHAVPQGVTHAQRRDRGWVGFAALTAALVVAGQAAPAGVARIVLLNLAGFAAVALVASRGTPEAKGAARRYLLLLSAGVACVAAAYVLGAESETAPAGGLAALIVALVVVGFGLKLALMPFYFWLPGVAEQSAPMTTALIVSVEGIAGFNELAALRVSTPWIFAEHDVLWLALAVLSMLGGAVLALGQRDVKRMLAFSTIDDMGYLLLGVALGSPVGMAGAAVGAMSHALCKVLLFGAVGVPECRDCRVVTMDSRGLAGRFPVSAAAFVVGALGTIGVPPTFGFAGRWRLYLSVASAAPLLLPLMALASCLAVLYYARAIHRVWLGGGDVPSEDRTGEPRAAVWVLVALMALTVVLGLAPALVTRWL